MRKDLHGLTLSTDFRHGGRRFRPRHAGVSQIPHGCRPPSRCGAQGRSRVRAGPCGARLLQHAGLQQGQYPGCRRGAGRGAQARQAHDHARGRPYRGAGALGRRRSRPHARRLARHLRRASARRAGLPPAPFQRLLARPAGDDAGRGRAHRARTGAPSCRAMATLLACRCFAHEEAGNYTAGRGRRPRRRSSVDPGDLWAAHARRACAGDAGPPRARASPGSTGLRAELGGRQQPHAPPVVAPRDVPPGAAASSTRCSRSTTAASATWLAAHPGACPTSTSTCRTPPPCCSGWSGRASMSATAGWSWPTRRRRGSATACPPSPCRTG